MESEVVSLQSVANQFTLLNTIQVEIASRSRYLNQEDPNEMPAELSEWQWQRVESICEMPSAAPLRPVLQRWHTICSWKS